MTCAVAVGVRELGSFADFDGWLAAQAGLGGR